MRWKFFIEKNIRFEIGILFVKPKEFPFLQISIGRLVILIGLSE
jgi:hypothetical protein